MKKKLIAFIAVILIILTLGIISSSAITYECDVQTHSSAVLVANLESDMSVFEKAPDKRRYASTMIELLDYLVVLDKVEDLETTVRLTPSLLADIPEKDGSLDKFSGKEMTVQDLLTVMMLTKGNDAAYVLAHHVGGGSISAFVTMLKDKLDELGCKRSTVISPRPVTDPGQVMTCNDIYRIIKELMKSESFLNAASESEYNIDKEKSQTEEYDYVTENSVKRHGSPYYFSYVKQSKYGYDKESGQNIASVGVYKDNSYVVVALGGSDDTETNAMTDTKQLLIWAFTKLENVKILPEDSVVASVKTKTPFGSDKVSLVSPETIIRTLPHDYVKDDVAITYDLPDEIELPVFIGQKAGKGTILYKGDEINSFDLVVANSKGVSIVEDVSSAISGMFNEILSNKPQPQMGTETETETETETAGTKD